MPAISVLSWNTFGGSMANLAAAINALNIDFTVIQEAQNTVGGAWYLPLTGLAGFTTVSGIRENAVRHTPTGQAIAYEPNVRRSYAYVYRNASVAGVAHALVDYVTDGAFLCPNLPFDAAQDGFNQRPPLRITLTHLGTPVVFYTWHAPVGHANANALTMFDGCNIVGADVATGNPVIIGADMNSNNIAAYFGAFQGLQDGLDAVIAANTVGAHVVDTRTTAITMVQAGMLNGLSAGSHYAVPAIVNY